DSSKKSSLLHTIHKVGYVTNELSKLKRGDILGLRGPFGTSWPLEDAKGKDICIIVGGIGLAPLRPAIYHILKHRKQYGKITLYYRADSSWRGHIGVVTSLMNYVKLLPERTRAMVCGPEIMMKYAVDELIKHGMSEKEIYVSLERNMKCALGFCGHCQYGPSFVCKDGPVFSFSKVTDIFEIKEL
ncbi:MAG TPA: FAD/NAD(P)-binding protein, partial [Ignavibacteria bacterium]|nr:FAD/NAD(P)-binding protein [Ignavibacteria bacterium]